MFNCSQIDSNALQHITYLERLEKFHFKIEQDSMDVESIGGCIGRMRQLKDLLLWLSGSKQHSTVYALKHCPKQIQALSVGNSTSCEDVKIFMKRITPMKHLICLEIANGSFSAQDLLKICNQREILEDFIFKSKDRQDLTEQDRQNFIKPFAGMKDLKKLKMKTTRGWLSEVETLRRQNKKLWLHDNDLGLKTPEARRNHVVRRRNVPSTGPRPIDHIWFDPRNEPSYIRDLDDDFIR